MKTLFISCIEASADLYAAKVLEQIPGLKQKYRLIGFGGKHLKQIGAELYSDITVHSTIGFLEPIFKLPLLLQKLNLAKQKLKEQKPDAILVVDGQGFHLPLIAYAKTLGIRVIYMIAPQVWQWGKTSAAWKFIKNIDLVLDIFPEAAEFYKKIHPNAHWIGHPLLDIAVTRLSEDTFRKQNQVREGQKVIGIFPGSRKQEVTRLLPLFLKVAEQLVGDQMLIVSCAHPELRSSIQKEIQKFKRPIQINTDSPHELMCYSNLCLTSSGTITLEMSILQAVMLVAYRFNPISFGLIKMILGAKAPKFIAWPNLMADKEIVPEFLQDRANVTDLVRTGINLLESSEKQNQIRSNLKTIKSKLGNPGASAKAAKLIDEFISGLS